MPGPGARPASRSCAFTHDAPENRGPDSIVGNNRYRCRRVYVKLTRITSPQSHRGAELTQRRTCPTLADLVFLGQELQMIGLLARLNVARVIDLEYAWTRGRTDESLHADSLAVHLLALIRPGRSRSVYARRACARCPPAARSST